MKPLLTICTLIAAGCTNVYSPSDGGMGGSAPDAAMVIPDAGVCSTCGMPVPDGMGGMLPCDCDIDAGACEAECCTEVGVCVFAYGVITVDPTCDNAVVRLTSANVSRCCGYATCVDAGPPT